MPGSTKRSLSFRFSHQTPVHASSLPHIRYIPSLSHSARFNHPHRWGVQIIKILFLKFSPFLCDKWVPVTTARRVLRLRMEEQPPVWRIAANILNKPSRTADKGWSFSLGVGRGANNSWSCKCIFVMKYSQIKPRLDTQRSLLFVTQFNIHIVQHRASLLTSRTIRIFYQLAVWPKSVLMCLT
jgi:hypothetical protein